MSLRARTLLYTAACLLLTSVALWVGLRYFATREARAIAAHITTAFGDIEREDAERNRSRALDALAASLENLEVKAGDWANWDDAWYFAAGRNPGFEEANIELNILLSLRLNFLMIFDKDGHPRHQSAADPLTGDTATIPASLIHWLRPDGGLLRTEADPTLTGVLPLEEGPLMISLQSLMRTSGVGPSAGTMLFARFLDSAEMHKIAKLTHLTLSLQPLVRGDALPAPDFTHPDTLTLYGIVEDFVGAPAYLLQIRLPREIQREGRWVLRHIQEMSRQNLSVLLLSVLFSGLLLLLVLFLILERLILRRIARLSSDASQIAAAEDFTQRVGCGFQNGKNCGRADEIRALGTAVNAMLDGLQKAHGEIARHEQAMRSLLNCAPLGLMTLDSEFRIRVGASRRAAHLLLDRDESDLLEGLTLTKLLVLDTEETAELEDYLDIYARGLLPDDLLPGLNPFPERILVGSDGTTRHVSVDFFPAAPAPEGERRSLLVVMADVSDRNALTKSLDRLQIENALLRVALRDPAMVLEFLDEAEEIVAEMRVKVWEQPLPDDAAQPLALPSDLREELFRQAHTVRGSAASLGLDTLHEACMALEKLLAQPSAVPEDGAGSSALEPELEPEPASPLLSSTPLQDLRDALERLSLDLVSTRALAQDLLGESARVGQSLVSELDLDRLRSILYSLRSHASEFPAHVLQESLDLLALWHLHPATQVFARALQAAERLIREGHLEVRLVVEGGAERVEPHLGRALNGALIHLVRNALAHGFESSVERNAMGKAPQGVLSLSFSRIADAFSVEVSDDGRGIPEAQVYRKAMALGLPVPADPTQDDLLRVLCAPGFSTRPHADVLAGRGVGLDAVAQAVGSLGGQLQLQTRAGSGSAFRVVIPTRIS